MNVKDLMISDVAKVQPSTPLKELLKLLVNRKIGGVPVVNERDQLAGMVTDGDVLRFVRPGATKLYDLFSYYVEYKREMEDIIAARLEKPVKSCMKDSGIVTVGVDDDLEQVVSVLAKHHFKKVPVLDDERRVVGVISRGDVIRSIVQKWIR